MITYEKRYELSGAERLFIDLIFPIIICGLGYTLIGTKITHGKSGFFVPDQQFLE